MRIRFRSIMTFMLLAMLLPKSSGNLSLPAERNVRVRNG